VQSGVNSTMQTTQMVGSGYGWGTITQQSAAAASVTAGANLSIQAAGNGHSGTSDVTLTGAAVTAQSGQATIVAANDVNIGPRCRSGVACRWRACSTRASSVIFA